MDTTAYIAALQQELAGIRSAVRFVCSGLTAAQLNWKPAPDSWSIAQCLHHLITADEQYMPRMELKIKEARSKGLAAKGPFKSGWFGKAFIRSMEPGGSRKYKVPKIFKPSESDLEADIPEKFDRHEQKLSSLFKTAEGLDLNRIKVRSPVNPLIQFRLGDAMNVLVTHQKRHFEQVKRIIEHPLFPKSK